MSNPDFKIVLYGDYFAGKTSLACRYIRQEFNTNVISTIGASYSIAPTKILKNEEKNSYYRMGIWDTAGGERYAQLIPLYLRKSDAVIYCWEYNKPFNVDKVLTNYDYCKEQAPNNLFNLVFTKIDLAHTPFIANKTAEELAQEYGFKVFYTSAKTGDGINNLFATISSDLVKIYETKELQVDKDPDSIVLTYKRTKCCKIV